MDNIDNSSSGLTDLDFSSFKRKVKIAYGLDLEAYKRPQMERRLRANMDKCGAATFTQYYSMMQNNHNLADEFLDRVTINVSELFRNPDQFETLKKTILPELLKQKSVLSVWSAGCSFGAEAYTLAILLDELTPGVKHSILATDIDDRMLKRAQEGVYHTSELKCVTANRLSKYFKPVGTEFAVKDSLKKYITLKKQDLLNDRFQSGFDLIVCRNVVIYFTDEAKTKLYTKFFEALRPNCYLFVGGTERITNYADIGYENKHPFFYNKPTKN